MTLGWARDDTVGVGSSFDKLGMTELVSPAGNADLSRNGIGVRG
jgi:hypothetical protein